MSVVIRSTPWAITAIPPITIHGASSSDSARCKAASAFSIGERLPARALGMVLDTSPASPHFLDRSLADRIARTGPAAHCFEGGKRRERMGHCASRARSLDGLEDALQPLGGSLTGEPALDRAFLPCIPAAQSLILMNISYLRWGSPE